MGTEVFLFHDSTKILTGDHADKSRTETPQQGMIIIMLVLLNVTNKIKLCHQVIFKFSLTII